MLETLPLLAQQLMGRLWPDSRIRPLARSICFHLFPFVHDTCCWYIIGWKLNQIRPHLQQFHVTNVWICNWWGKMTNIPYCLNRLICVPLFLTDTRYGARRTIWLLICIFWMYICTSASDESFSFMSMT